ncbi:MAG: hypothetical protein LBH10_03100 [Burkholderiaceae bacterium]|jgi:hypothetical protein|nr:hypothetical protein [Burkholderiaceae bacterium]
MDRGQRALTGCVGIFWGIPSAGNGWTLLADAAPLAAAEPYGDFLDHPRGHYELWEHWKAQGAAAPLEISVAQAIARHEYEDFPRGRIVFDVKNRRFIVYADRRLQQEGTLAAIARQFGLKPGTFVVRSDSHYRSRG